MENILPLEFATNIFGKLKPDIKERLQRVIDKPSEENWEDARTIIIEDKHCTTLWQAVINVDACYRILSLTPSKEVILKAIKQIVFTQNILS